MASIEMVKGRKYIGTVKGSRTLTQFSIVGITKSKKYVQLRSVNNEGDSYFKWEDIDNLIILDEIDESEEMND